MISQRASVLGKKFPEGVQQKINADAACFEGLGKGLGVVIARMMNQL